MISYIKGVLVEVDQNMIIVEGGSIGYNIHVPLSLIEKLPQTGSELILHTFFQVKDDGTKLYGFLDKQDLKMFRQLIGVNGIGPKGALGILSAMTPDQVRRAIVSDDAKAFTVAPGVGIKTAKRIILDLRDRISSAELLPELVGTEVVAQLQPATSGKDAVEALIGLGYSKAEATKAVGKVVHIENKTVEDILKEALKYLAFI